MTLVEEKAVPVKPGMSPLSRQEAEDLLKETPQWTLKDNTIEREFTLKDFREAVDFVNEVADIAETQDHHPDIDIRYNKVKLVFATHRIGGLSRNDFILAAKINRLA